MIRAFTAIFLFQDSVKADTINKISGKSEPYTATGGIQPEYFLGGILFIILIMILMLLIKIMNIKQKKVSDKQIR
jgi:hypothetical protein